METVPIMMLLLCVIVLINRRNSKETAIEDPLKETEGDESEYKTPLALKIIISIGCLVALFGISYVVDDMAFENAYYHKLILDKTDCSKKLPSNVKIIFNGKYYAVKRKDNTYGEQFLYSRGDHWMYKEIASGDLFLDSCNAKDAYFFYTKRDNHMKDFR